MGDPNKRLSWRKAIIAKAYGEAMSFREIWRVLVDHGLVGDEPRLGSLTSAEQLDAIIAELALVGKALQMTFTVSPEQLDTFKRSLEPK